MTSQSFAGLLGAIVGIVVLGAAIYYGPIGQFGKPPKPLWMARAELAGDARMARSAALFRLSPAAVRVEKGIASEAHVLSV